MRWFAFAALPLLAVVFAGCESNEGSACGEAEAGVTTLTVHLGTNADGSMYMTPSGLQAAQGAKVRFQVVNDDAKVFHDFAVLNLLGDGKNLEHEVDGGATVCTTHEGKPYVVLDKRGSFTVVCEVSGHKELGMKMKDGFKVV